MVVPGNLDRLMAKSKTKLVSRFPEAKKGGHDAVDAAIKEALITGQEEAQARLGRSGHDVDPFNVHKKHFKGRDGLDGGMIFVHSDHWYYRFFETGTVYIRATPFMRPAHRKMRKAFEDELGDKFEGFVAKRARLGKSIGR